MGSLYFFFFSFSADRDCKGFVFPASTWGEVNT